MKNALIFTFLLFTGGATFSQSIPVIQSWIINTDSSTGYAGILSNVQVVQYDSNNVYISCTCIPGYDIGPWNNPNVAENQNFVFKITRHPQKNTGTATAVGLGHIGVWTNGVSIFNADDAQTYNNQGVWHRNAYYFEYPSFDNCLGHAQQQGEYHHHVNPKCLYNDMDSTHHSPIIGFAFDGYPIYGAYAYADTDGTGGIKRMESGYRMRNITDRTTLPDGSTATYAGPAIGGQYPLGAFIQDYEWVQGYGDLDERNGRFCVTPEYPNGTYAYFVTIDASHNPVYPFTLGDTYYGTVQAGNTGMQSGHNTPSGPTIIYTPDTTHIDTTHIDTTTGINRLQKEIKLSITPNPTTGYVYIYMDPQSDNNVTATLYDMKGTVIKTMYNLQPSISYSINLTDYAAGTYLLRLLNGNTSTVKQIVKLRQ